MEKYKSDFIKEEDIKINVSKRNLDEDAVIRIVEVKHIPSGFIASSEDKSQVRAYNQAIVLLEDMITSYINSQF